MSKQKEGQLFYLVGPSGSGKDSLLKAIVSQYHLNGHLNGLLDNRISVVQRVITRPVTTGDESHLEMSVDEFDLAQQANHFAFYWQAHGCMRYGVRHSSLDLLKQGVHVLLNGSRAYLPTALKLMPKLQVLSIEVDRSVLEKRLTGRGRESVEAIEKRLLRADQFNQHLPEGALLINNSGRLSDAVNQLAGIINAY